jgi:hypothetical protein
MAMKKMLIVKELVLLGVVAAAMLSGSSVAWGCSGKNCVVEPVTVASAGCSGKNCVVEPVTVASAGCSGKNCVVEPVAVASAGCHGGPK